MIIITVIFSRCLGYFLAEIFLFSDQSWQIEQRLWCQWIVLALLQIIWGRRLYGRTFTWIECALEIYGITLKLSWYSLMEDLSSMDFAACRFWLITWLLNCEHLYFLNCGTIRQHSYSTGWSQSVNCNSWNAEEITSSQSATSAYQALVI